MILPNVLAIGLVFGGVDAGEDAGPLLYNLPSIGLSLDDYWLRGYPNPGDSWALFTFGGVPPINFGVRITAADSSNRVPDAGSTFGLISVGLGLLAFASRGRRA